MSFICFPSEISWNLSNILSYITQKKVYHWLELLDDATSCPLLNERLSLHQHWCLYPAWETAWLNHVSSMVAAGGIYNSGLFLGRCSAASHSVALHSSHGQGTISFNSHSMLFALLLLDRSPLLRLTYGVVSTYLYCQTYSTISGRPTEGADADFGPSAFVSMYLARRIVLYLLNKAAAAASRQFERGTCDMDGYRGDFACMNDCCHGSCMPRVCGPAEDVKGTRSRPRTLCRAVDALLSGCGAGGHADDGLLPGHVYEIFGAAGSGKTQLALATMLGAVACPLGDASTGAPSAIYLVAEDVPIRRLQQMAQGRAEGTIQPQELLSRILIRHVASAEQLRSVLLELLLVPAQGSGGVNFLLHNNVNLIVIDSIAAVVAAGRVADDAPAGRKRPRVDGPDAYSGAHSDELCRCGSLLKLIAHRYGITVLITNQVRQSFDDWDTGGKLVPALGLRWSAEVCTRLMIEKITSGVGPVHEDLSRSAGDTPQQPLRVLSIVFSPYLARSPPMNDALRRAISKHFQARSTGQGAQPPLHYSIAVFMIASNGLADVA